MTDGKLELFGDSRSGNCYKLKLLCAEMGIDYDWTEVDIMAGETHTEDFLAKNPNGKIPLLVLPDGRCLAESNAILYYLADGSEYFSGDAFERAEIMQWMCFEQYSHEPNIATSRFIIQYLGNPPERAAALVEKKAGGEKALAVMEQHLADKDAANDYFAGGRFSIADIALFAYTHVADEGGFGLDAYPAIRGWISRVEARPNFVPMAST